MELPRPPEDPEMTKIIDKLANFVARNGPEFEQMTKQKQRDNPKFAFLFGGENFNYYQYKVTTEQAILKKQHMMEEQHKMLAQQQQVLVQQEKEQAAAALKQQVISMQQQVNNLQSQMAEQISQSEQNLAAQYQSMMRQQQIQIEELILIKRQDQLKVQADQCEVNLAAFDEAMQPIIDTCTKEAILNGKTWIVARALSEDHCDMIANYFLDRLTSKEASFSLRLHLIYLMYDIIHHCVRRNVAGLKESLEKVVVPIFCTARVSAEEGPQVEKLEKLLKLWETHSYLHKEVLEKLHDPAQALSAYQATLITENADIVTQITSGIKTQYNLLQKQHQDFCNHLTLQLSTAQQQLALLISQEQQLTSQTAGSGDGQNSAGPPPSGYDSYPPPSVAPSVIAAAQAAPPQQFEYSHGRAAPTPMAPNQFALPDLSKPPPGFPPPGPGLPPPSGAGPPLLPTDMDLKPSVPYYNLPAGLMAPLVKWDESTYKPLDPKDIRLPPPMAPSERLLAAVDAFYTLPSRERPRDSDGWEKLGLYEFFKAKQKARSGRRPYSRSPSRSRSRSRSRSASRSRSRSRSPSPQRRRRFDSEGENRSRSRSRSASPQRRRRFHNETDDKNRNRSKSASPPSHRRPRSRSRSHSSSRSRSRSPHRRRSRSRTPERLPQEMRKVSRERSPTPPLPSFGGLDMASMMQLPEQRLGEANKGHQLMMKMGWGGKGLGATEQGIVDPIEAADVRDKVDMRKGIGIDLRDPFEQFRKSKAQGFIQRMRARDDGSSEPSDRKKSKKKDRDSSN